MVSSWKSWSVLVDIGTALLNKKEYRRVKDLADSIGIPRSKISSPLAYLESEGVIELIQEGDIKTIRLIANKRDLIKVINNFIYVQKVKDWAKTVGDKSLWGSV